MRSKVRSPRRKGLIRSNRGIRAIRAIRAIRGQRVDDIHLTSANASRGGNHVGNRHSETRALQQRLPAVRPRKNKISRLHFGPQTATARRVTLGKLPCYSAKAPGRQRALGEVQRSRIKDDQCHPAADRAPVNFPRVVAAESWALLLVIQHRGALLVQKSGYQA